MKAVIFDFDGVLVDSMEYHVTSWRKALNAFNIFPSDNELVLLEGMSYQDTIDFLADKHSVELSAKDKEKLYRQKREVMNEIMELRIYSAVSPLLELLQNHKITLALVTGSSQEFASPIIAEKFPDIFQVIVTGSDVAHSKPDPEPYNLALQKLKLKPDNVVVIENAPLGIESAKKAGLEVLALTTTLDPKYLKEADKVFPNHAELLEYLKSSIG